MKDIPLPKAALPTECIVLEVPISDDMETFIELITGNHTHCGDVLINGFCGYWAYGVQRNQTQGWLVYVDPISCGNPPGPGLDQEYAVHCFSSGETLPEDYYVLDREVAKKALKHGLTRWGDSFLNGNCDYSDYDQTIQMALFDEVVYG